MARQRRSRERRLGFAQRARARGGAEASGFNVHAGVTVRSGDREGLERSCRYGVRPE